MTSTHGATAKDCSDEITSTHVATAKASSDELTSTNGATAKACSDELTPAYGATGKTWSDEATSTHDDSLTFPWAFTLCAHFWQIALTPFLLKGTKDKAYSERPEFACVRTLRIGHSIVRRKM